MGCLTDVPYMLVMQLRNLVWATSKHDVYLMSHFSVIHWSSLSCTKSEVLNVSGHVAPSEVSVFLILCSTYQVFIGTDPFVLPI